MWTGASHIVFLSALVTHSMGEYGSECQLPNEQKGVCMPVYSCKSIFQQLNTIRDSGGQLSAQQQNMFAQRHCGSFQNVHHVCCAESDIQLNSNGLEILRNQSCGTYDINKLSNGHEAALFAFPWMALLIYNDTSQPYKCTGSIISEQYVLTAAHCVCCGETPLLVRLGEHRISTERDCIAGGKLCAPPVEDIEIEEIIRHENYVKFHHDIALIRLKRKVKFEVHIQPLCLPILDSLKSNVLEQYVISGWGRTDKELVSDVLMVALVPLVPRSECQTILKRHRFRVPLQESEFCAGNEGMIDTCPGDSGGPVGYKAMYGGNPRFVQFGLTSFGTYLCGEGNAPTVYTNVSHYVQWITDRIRI